MTPEQKLIAELIPLAGDAIDLATKHNEPSAKELLFRLDTLASSPTGIKAVVAYVYAQPNPSNN
jgi:hypothetical protein